MIVKEKIAKPDGTRFIVTYSDQGYYIKKRNNGMLYREAIDVIPCRFKYDETDILIPVKEEKKVEETIKEE